MAYPRRDDYGRGRGRGRGRRSGYDNGGGYKGRFPANNRNRNSQSQHAPNYRQPQRYGNPNPNPNFNQNPNFNSNANLNFNQNPKSIKSPIVTTIVILGLSADMDRDGLKTLLQANTCDKGALTIKKDLKRKIGFVKYQTVGQAAIAMQTLNQLEYKVEWEDPNKKKQTFQGPPRPYQQQQQQYQPYQQPQHQHQQRQQYPYPQQQQQQQGRPRPYRQNQQQQKQFHNSKSHGDSHRFDKLQYGNANPNQFRNNRQTKLYVENTPPFFSKTHLLKIFGKFGHIVDYQIGNSKPRQKTFLRYKDPNHAQQAFNDINNTIQLGFREPIYVRFPNRHPQNNSNKYQQRRRRSFDDKKNVNNPNEDEKQQSNLANKYNNEDENEDENESDTESEDNESESEDSDITPGDQIEGKITKELDSLRLENKKKSKVKTHVKSQSISGTTDNIGTFVCKVCFSCHNNNDCFVWNDNKNCKHQLGKKQCLINHLKEELQVAKENGNNELPECPYGACSEKIKDLSRVGDISTILYYQWKKQCGL